MSRLLLTYMHNKKVQGIDSISLFDIIETVGDINLDLYDDGDNQQYNITYICDTLQNMLNHLPRESEEMWRRPIYYKNNALICSNQDIGKNLLKQYIDKSNKIYTSFSITEEGSTFIERIVPQFEFYSARLSHDSVPLFCIENKETLIVNIKRVYEKVEQCCERQIIFMQRYKEKYNIKDTTKYLNEDFHPVTNAGRKQLHIIRVIFSHIMYLNNFREYLYNNRRKKFNKYNRIIVYYISRYLKLYDEKFYEIMHNTIGNYNNEVWDELVPKCNKAILAINHKSTNAYGDSIVRDRNIEGEEHNTPKPQLLDITEPLEGK